MAFGPTQNYDDASLGAWTGRPILATATRGLIAVVPIVLTVGLGLAAVHWFPPRRLGVDPWIWLLAEMCCATLTLVLATRMARRFVPLTMLLRLTLYFPDRAPSRLGVAMRHYSPDALQTGVDAAGRGRRLRPRDEHAARILGLVAAISDHDELTRGHSERVQAYSALIGRELGMSGEEAAKLSWAALLHDVGKLRVPASVLSKPGLPSTEDWSVLVDHPTAGMEIAEPLAEWLGPWLDVIGQHHERWDGGGYPAGLAGEAISRGARIVAVADAYDVITSARSYKRALPASAARAELARCAGEQFDPEVVRAFLSIGLGKLHRVAGPLSIFSALPGLPSFAGDLPSAVQRLTTVSALKSTAAIGLALSVSTAIVSGPWAGGPPSTDEPGTTPADSSAIGTPLPESDRNSVVVPDGQATAAADAPSDPQASPPPGAGDAPSQVPSAVTVGDETVFVEDGTTDEHDDRGSGGGSGTSGSSGSSGTSGSGGGSGTGGSSGTGGGSGTSGTSGSGGGSGTSGTSGSGGGSGSSGTSGSGTSGGSSGTSGSGTSGGISGTSGSGTSG